MVIFFKFSPTSSHLRPLQVEDCDSNSRLVVDEDDNGKFRLERVTNTCIYSSFHLLRVMNYHYTSHLKANERCKILECSYTGLHFDG